MNPALDADKRAQLTVARMTRAEKQTLVFAFFATYGLTRYWDVGIVLPIVHLHMRADAEATIVRNSSVSQQVHNFGPQSDSPRSTGGGDETGIGDVILRTKYNFLRDRPGLPDLAIVGDIKLPTGDEDDLLGTGDTNFRALLVVSRTFGLLTPHVNFGYEWTTGGSEQNNVRYVAGFDARVLPSLTLSTDVIGRWEPSGDGIGGCLRRSSWTGRCRRSRSGAARWTIWRRIARKWRATAPRTTANTHGTNVKNGSATAPRSSPSGPEL